MKTMASDPNLQADERIVMAVARAMCGHASPCRYHVAQARIAIPAYRLANGREVLDRPLMRIGSDGEIVVVPHEGIVR
jgi:hypothetical protein